MEWRNKAVKHQIWGWDFCNDRFTMHLLYLSMTNTFPPWQLGYLLKREALSCFFIHTCRQIKHVELKHAKENLVVHTIGLIFESKSEEYYPILPDLHQRKYNVSKCARVKSSYKFGFFHFVLSYIYIYIFKNIGHQSCVEQLNMHHQYLRYLPNQ